MTQKTGIICKINYDLIFALLSMGKIVDSLMSAGARLTPRQYCVRERLSYTTGSQRKSM